MNAPKREFHRRPAVLVSAILLTVIGFIAAIAKPASAAWSSCPAEAICLYPALNGVGVPVLKYPPTFGCNQLEQGTRNDAESAWNRAGETVWLRDGDNCSGSSYSILNGGRVSHLGSFRNLTNSVETR